MARSGQLLRNKTVSASQRSASYAGDKTKIVRVAHTIFSAFHSPERRLDQPQVSGGLGEHCSSPAVGRGVCAPPGRVAQPLLLAADRGNPAGAANRGRLFFGYFILAKQKKVACCRATPGEVAFVFGYSCFDTAIRSTQHERSLLPVYTRLRNA